MREYPAWKKPRTSERTDQRKSVDMIDPHIRGWKLSKRRARVSSHFGFLIRHTCFSPLLDVCFHPWPHELSDTSRIDVLTQGCDKSCMEENNVFRKVSGSKGRNRPVLESHTISRSVFGTRVLDNFSDVVLSCRSCCNC